MATHADMILEFIHRFPGRDDDEIARALAISARQQVNQICRRLERGGRITRAPGSSGKIANFPSKLPHQQIVATDRPKISAPTRPRANCDELLTLKELGQDRLHLAQIVLRHTLLPNPVTVAAFRGAVFPSIRDQRNRVTVGEVGGRRVLLDDNVTPRWALLWAHGITATHHLAGWTFAHVWSASKDPEAYTHLANLCMMPEFFGSLSDKRGPLCPYLRHHAWLRYGWCLGSDEPVRPDGYEALDWHYLPEIPDPVGFVEARLAELDNERVRLLRAIC
jgi:hypothetical protein